MAHTITELEALSYNRQATIIYLDQLPWRTTATRVVKALELAVGQRCQSGALGRQVLDKEKQFAMEMSLQLLSYRIRSRREIDEKLEKRKISAEAAEATLAKLEQAGYINDNAFAKTWINERIEIHGHGRQRIKSELLSKGINAEVIERELDRVYSAEKEKCVALELAEKRLARYAGLDEAVVRRRLMQVLMRRGFSAQTAQKVLKDLLA
ncbi:MAG: regulatory protein RecX [Actinomycetota bacterium]|nr:regulatory protein RecX [Actinomycetota bacterium]